MEMGHAVLRSDTLARSYPVIANLEIYGTYVWHNQYELGKEDIEAMQDGKLSNRFVTWYEAQLKHDADLQAQLRKRIQAG